MAERSLESRSRAKEGWDVWLSWGLAGKAQAGDSITGRQLWACVVGGSVCQPRGHAAQYGEQALRFKYSKIAVKVLREHVLLQTGHGQRALRSYPVLVGSGYVKGGYKMGPGSRGPSWGQWCLLKTWKLRLV